MESSAVEFSEWRDPPFLKSGKTSQSLKDIGFRQTRKRKGLE